MGSLRTEVASLRSFFLSIKRVTSTIREDNMTGLIDRLRLSGGFSEGSNQVSERKLQVRTAWIGALLGDSTN
jgi:hypothetical protein